MYAVIQTGGKRYRVAAGDTLEIEKLELAPGVTRTFEQVLLVSKDGNITVGNPTVAGAKVTTDVVGATKATRRSSSR
jgi:large subunit ribosomal protein L21